MNFALESLKAVTSTLRRLILPTAHERRVRAWKDRDGDRTLRVEYPLSPESTVLDVGGYEGQWASDIFARYCCRIEVFEPWPAFAAGIAKRFLQNPSITVHPYGLGAQDRTDDLYAQADGTSLFARVEGSARERVLIRSIAAVWIELGLDTVDLMKVNIEGGEYELLEALIATHLIERVHNLQVQFHEFVPDAHTLYRHLSDRLTSTHHLTYSVPFVWENWTLRAETESRGR